MDKSFIIENAVKTTITTVILIVCWATVSPVFAQGIDDHRARFTERMAEMRGNADKDLSVDQVRDIVEGRLAMMGNTNLKVGGVSESDADKVIVDIVTQEDSLVQTMEISTRTGRPTDAERRFGRMGGREFGMRGSRMGRNRRGGGFSALALAMGPKNRDLSLTIDQARTLAESRLILAGNDRLKVGSVEAINEETIAVEIVTVDDSLVVRREIDRNSGRVRHDKSTNE